MSLSTAIAPMMGDQDIKRDDSSTHPITPAQSQFDHRSLSFLAAPLTASGSDSVHASHAHPTATGQSNETYEPNDSNPIAQILQRIQRPADIQQKQNEIETETDTSNQHVLRHHTPEAPSPSPLASSNSNSRPSTAQLIDEAESAHRHPNLGLQEIISSFFSNRQNELVAGLSTHRTSEEAAERMALPGSSLTENLLPNGDAQLRGGIDMLLQNTVQELGDSTKDHLQKAKDAGRIDAFAKIDFGDGYFYMTTTSLELGRDELAFKAAMRKAKKQEERGQLSRPSTSSGNASKELARRAADSQVQGSVVSERGGFLAYDHPRSAEEKQAGAAEFSRSQSSQVSSSSGVRMEDLELNRRPTFDYKSRMEEAMEADHEKPAPVTADHLPRPDSNPLIPIHPVTDNGQSRLDVHAEIEAHKSISRRHARIAWDHAQQCFVLVVLGRNGAFLNQEYLKHGSSAPLRNDALIEISGIQMHFRLPQVESSENSENDDEHIHHRNNQSTSPTSDDELNPTFISRGKGAKTSKNQKPTPLPDYIGPDGEMLVPPKKRGPGRPPKDGIMSARERKLIEKARKAAEAKEANGGITPPPSGRAGVRRPAPSAEAQIEQPQQEKRKYTKRKREDDEGDGDDILPSVEGSPAQNSGEDTKSAKKRRAALSPSPDYPPEHEVAHLIGKPTENYARMIYGILMDIYPTGLGLRQIYRRMRLKFPYFLYGADTDGWTSSVRHNLHGEVDKLFKKGEKLGKGYKWHAIPGRLTELKGDMAKNKKGDTASQAAAGPNSAQNSFGPPQNWQQASMQPFGHPQGFHPQGQPPFPPQSVASTGFHRGQPYPPQGGPSGHGPSHAQWVPPGAGQGGAYHPALQPNRNGAFQSRQPLANGQNSAGSFPVGVHPAGNIPNHPGVHTINQQGLPLNSSRPLLAQQQGRTGSHGSAPSPIQHSQAPSYGFLPSNMPALIAGVNAVRALGGELLACLPAEKHGILRAIFESARGQVMHGLEGSNMPAGQQNLQEEKQIIAAIEWIVSCYRNPSYIKPAAKKRTPMATPVPEQRNQVSVVEKASGGDSNMVDLKEDSVPDQPERSKLNSEVEEIARDTEKMDRDS